MKKSRLLLTFLLVIWMFFSCTARADLEDYTTLRDIDKWTFNEYRYLMVKEYFKLKEKFELNWKIDKPIVLSLLNYAKVWYNYLPDSLMNQNMYNNLSIAVKRWYDTPNSEVNYEEIVNKLNDYLEKVNIQVLKWTIEVSPSTWNAPLTSTFRWKVTDPSWTIIPSSNYIWWVDAAWTKKIIWKWLSINYTFKEEWGFSVFLDVKSSHKNKSWYTDVLPFSSRWVVEVKEKIASLIIKVNSTSLREADEVKFTPDEASYWLIFDATSSTPTGWARFRRVEWDFWNWVERRYDWSPKIERVVYSKEWNFTVKLKLYTNEWKSVERQFVVAIHKPIATIQASTEEWYIWEKFTFSAKSSVDEKNLSFYWNIIDINNDKIIASKEWSVISQVFSDKWRYNIQLKVKDAAWDEDVDTKIIYVNSRAPIAEFNYSIPNSSKPNRVLLDWTRSYDPDFSDDGKLKYVWNVNWEIIELENPDSKWAIWYYTFDSVWEQSVVLEVIDSDQISWVKQQKVKIASVLSVDFFALPRVIQRSWFVKFVATSPNAKYFEWDFGDGNKKSWTSSKVEYVYEKSWTFNAKLTVRDNDWNSNEFTKIVYVWESNAPLAIISMDFWSNEEPRYDSQACSKWAYIIDRIKAVNFKWSESLNIDWSNENLSYTWKIWNDKYISAKDTTYKFDELWCFPIKLTVKSNKNWSLSSTESWVKVENLKPELTTLDLAIQNETTDPIVVNVSALWAKDPDWVIQSYLWYYYTDSDVDPQDFRITTTPATTFVIPKVTWNYYFVVVMRDNNDERYSSDESTLNKFFISLSWDNINTPLIDFKVNKNNVLIWEEAIFSATVKNVLWQNITDKSEFAWDFDWDGFYDKETNSWNISYTFKNSWTFYAKVRVKYKWMTNVRSIEMNVANILSPDFSYTSIWDTYLFFNTSAWKFDHSTWDLWDGTQMFDKNYFSHTYTDWNKVHNVKLKISEWTKSKDKEKEVVINLKNMLTSKNATWLYVITNPEAIDDKITLQDNSENVIININTASWATNYWVDFDINTDSDLNWGKDDDIDNKNDSSFSKAGLVEITLNDKKTQTFRVFTLDEQFKVIESKDITIEKEYIKNEEVDINTLTFSWVTNDEKAKIEKLKSYVQSLPQEHRLKATQYVQKLQEEWFYINEKTKIILEFEAFIDSLWVSNWTDIVNLLESFLIEWQEDQSVRNMAYNVVKNLIPKELVEYDNIIKNLDQIKANPSKLEENKVLGKEILEAIKDTSLIENDDKVTIKTQLQVFIYGSVDNIPEEIVKEVKQEDSSSGKIIWLFSWVVNFIWILFAVIIFIILWFYIWFKVSNKNKNQWLHDFIIEKTSNKQSDILWGLWNIESINPESEKPASDMMRTISTPEDKKPKENKDFLTQNTTLKTSETKKVDEANKVPDWLRWAINTDALNKEETSTSKDLVWEEKVIETETKVEETPEEENVSTPEVSVSPETVETKVEEEAIPDWLKGALPKDTPKVETKAETTETKAEETPKEENVSTPEVSVSPETVETKVEEEAVPDWLKGALDTNKLKDKKTEEKKEEPKTESSPKAKESSKKEKSNDELWNDWMEVPDWLKQETPKEEKKSKTSTSTPKTTKEKKDESTSKAKESSKKEKSKKE